MNLLSLKKDIRDIERLEEIFRILSEEGYHFLIDRIHKKKNSEAKLISPIELRELFEKLGPTYIKLGQLLSIRSDLVPHEYCEELKKLQDSVQPISYDQIKKVIDSELGVLSKDLKSIEKKPLSTASISQVHLATLKGKKVVIKVQKPGIRKIMEADIDIMEYVAKELDKHPQFKSLNPIMIVKEFKDYTERELDFRYEMRNQKKFHEYFSTWKTVGIPKAYVDYTKSKIIVMEFIDGCSLRDKEGVLKLGMDKKKVALIGFEAILYQVFELGFLHGDPHPANVIVSKDKKLYFIDFGIVGYITPQFQNELLKALISLMNKDVKGTVRYFLNFSKTTIDSDVDSFREEAEYIMNSWYGSSFKEMRFTSMIYELLKIAAKYHIEVPADIVLVAKGLLTTEGTACEYDPDFNITREVKPILNKIILKRFGPQSIEAELKKDTMLISDLLENLPQRAEQIVDKIEKGEISVKIESAEIREIERTMQMSSDKKALSVLAGLVFIGSAVMTFAGSRYELFGYPLAFLGFLISLFLGTALMVIFIKDKDKR
ncbi:MAG: AarF/UbiB family protein [Candidatus Woesearchaeota archaeon]|nr:AarF/UbiB family protein [Candidatus Woesearchaeota archaeon]